jgi:hypothetical protein
MMKRRRFREAFGNLKIPMLDIPDNSKKLNLDEVIEKVKAKEK